MLGKVIIRKEIPADIPEIRRLNDLAFHRPVEGSIVDALRERCQDVLSLVAVEGSMIVGHLFFSPVDVKGMTGTEAMALGPMDVLPKFQRKGIGKALINEGIRRLEQSGCAVVVVLGHTEYYPRFGFVPASQYGLKSQWEGIPADVFMVRFLKKEKIGLATGIVRYQREFDTTTKQVG